ncbi:hypothetical protein [Saccharothrix xinjiangensis]|uniref:Secreted protein n=1 Tax=Saccharothrix xinjiangensis TaxID=204798 RepID=A0ABV9XXP9_9PSEU
MSPGFLTEVVNLLVVVFARPAAGVVAEQEQRRPGGFLGVDTAEPTGARSVRHLAARALFGLFGGHADEPRYLRA